MCPSGRFRTCSAWRWSTDWRPAGRREAPATPDTGGTVLHTSTKRRPGRWAVFLAVSILGLLTASSAYAYVASQSFTCPLCGTHFKGPVVVSEYVGGLRLDLKPVGSDAAPHPLPVCPRDHFVLYKDDLTKAEVAKMRALVGTTGYRAAVKEGSAYVLLARILEERKAEPGAVAFALLKASWEVEGDSLKWRRCATASLEWYEKVLATRPSSAPIDAANVVRVELLRRLGRFDLAQGAADSLLARQPQPDAPLPQILEYERRLILSADRDPHEIPRGDE